MTRTVIRHGRRIEVETVETGAAPRRQRGKRDKHMGAPWVVWVTLCKAKLTG